MIYINLTDAEARELKGKLESSWQPTIVRKFLRELDSALRELEQKAEPVVTTADDDDPHSEDPSD